MRRKKQVEDQSRANAILRWGQLGESGAEFAERREIEKALNMSRRNIYMEAVALTVMQIALPPVRVGDEWDIHDEMAWLKLPKETRDRVLASLKSHEQAHEQAQEDWIRFFGDIDVQSSDGQA